MSDITLTRANDLPKDLRAGAAVLNSKNSPRSTKGVAAFDLGLCIVANPTGKASFAYRANISGEPKPEFPNRSRFPSPFAGS